MTEKAKVLLILIEPPLPFGNAASRWFHVLLHGLLAKGYRVDTLVASGVDKDIEKAKAIFKDERRFKIFPFGKSHGLRGKIESFLFPHRSKFSPEFMQALRDMNPDSYDIVHIEQTWAGWTAFPWRKKALINVHHLQTIDLQFAKAPTAKEQWLYKRWFATEKKILSRYPFVRICSPRLRGYIEPWGEKKAVDFVPVGIDISLYPFIPPEKRQKEPVITLIGNMTWYPSISAAERMLQKLWPEIRKQVPGAKLKIVGWSARSALKKYLNEPGVEISENVPDIQPYFEQASVMVYAPSRGSGMKIKILEAMGFGIPVVTTAEGIEGLPARDMVDAGISEDDEGLIERTVKILHSPELQNQLRGNARKLLEKQCSPEVTVAQIEKLYEKIMNQNQ